MYYFKLSKRKFYWKRSAAHLDNLARLRRVENQLDKGIFSRLDHKCTHKIFERRRKTFRLYKNIMIINGSKRNIYIMRKKTQLPGIHNYALNDISIFKSLTSKVNIQTIYGASSGSAIEGKSRKTQAFKWSKGVITDLLASGGFLKTFVNVWIKMNVK